MLIAIYLRLRRGVVTSAAMQGKLIIGAFLIAALGSPSVAAGAAAADLRGASSLAQVEQPQQRQQ